MTFFSQPTARLIASGLKSGFAPFSPGTAGSAAAACVWVVGLYCVPVEPRFLAVFLLALTLITGIPATAAAIKDQADQDPSWIVIDEWAGLFLTFCVAPQTSLTGILLGFALFRVFDIVKIGPVGCAERIKGAWGIIADDLVAGFLAAMVLLAVR